MIGLIACCAQKSKRREAPARALYTSPLFRLSLDFIEPLCTDVYVLSAFHHLVPIDKVIHTYDRRLPTAKKEREQWGRITGSSLVDQYKLRNPANAASVEFLMLAGKDYADQVGRELRICGGFGDAPADDTGPFTTRWRGVPRDHIHEPLAGMMIGERLSWLKKRIAARAAGETRSETMAIIRGAFRAR